MILIGNTTMVRGYISIRAGGRAERVCARHRVDRAGVRSPDAAGEPDAPLPGVEGRQGSVAERCNFSGTRGRRVEIRNVKITFRVEDCLKPHKELNLFN